jgi:predicted SPOUT superfamily RNA methylase MTH1
VTLPSPSPGARANTKTLVEAGLRIHVTVDAAIPESTRVTLQLPPDAEAGANDGDIKAIRAEAVDPAAPREEGGYYWGYSVRRAGSLSAVFEECPFDGGYDVTIGTSERGIPLESIFPSGSSSPGLARFNHLLLVLGGVSGLETALKNDPKLHTLGVVDVREVFDHWVNVLPGQGSRTIRTEEALWIALMGMRRAVARNGEL